MKVTVKHGGYPPLILALPTRLLFSKTLLRLYNGPGRRHTEEELPYIPPEAMEAIYREIKNANRRLGRWNLLEAESADGDLVTIRL